MKKEHNKILKKIERRRADEKKEQTSMFLEKQKKVSKTTHWKNRGVVEDFKR